MPLGTDTIGVYVVRGGAETLTAEQVERRDRVRLDGEEAIRQVLSVRHPDAGPVLVDTTWHALPGLEPIRHRSHGNGRVLTLDYGRDRARGVRTPDSEDPYPVHIPLPEPAFDPSASLLVLQAMELEPGAHVRLPFVDHDNETIGYHTVNVIGPESVPSELGTDVEAWRLEVTLPDGRGFVYWLDRTTRRLLRGESLPEHGPRLVLRRTPDRRMRDDQPFPVREVGYELDLEVDLAEELLRADVRLTVENQTDRSATEVPLLLYRLMTVRSVAGGEGARLPFEQSVESSPRNPRKQVRYVRASLPRPLRPGERTTLRIVYDGYLAGYAETGARYVRDRIDEEFTILREDALAYPQVGRPGAPWPELPSFDYEARVTVPSTHVVANGGELVRREVADDKTSYTFRNTRTAWRMDFAVARYQVIQDAAFRVYHLPGDSAGAAGVLEGLRRSMALYGEWLGPLEATPRLTVIEIPDGYGSQKDVTSVLQTAAAFADPGRLYEVYHEVSHFWNVPPTDRPSPRLEEGLASYLEDAAWEALHGEARLDRSITRLEEWVRSTFEANPEYGRLAMADYGREDVTGLSYGVGELMFFALAEVVGGPTLHEIIGEYYRRFHESGAGVRELADVADELTTIDLVPFFEHWLFTAEWYGHLSAGETTREYAVRYRERFGGAVPGAGPEVG